VAPLEPQEKVLVSRDFLTTVYGEISCEECHGGDPIAVDKAEAHKGMEPYPAVKDPEKVCGECHEEIVSTAKRTGSRVVGPVPLPNKQKLFTVLRSPHVDKKSREQFELIRHKRILGIVSPAEQTMDALMKLSISAGVDVEIR